MPTVVAKNDNCPLPKTIPSWDEFSNKKWTKVRRWCQPIIKECVEKHGLDLDLVSAIVWTETKGDPSLINPNSGATGLMQIMPKHVIPGRPSQARLLNPRVNIPEGCTILYDYINLYKSEKDGVWAYGGTNGSYAQYADIVLSVRDTIEAAYP